MRTNSSIRQRAVAVREYRCPSGSGVAMCFNPLSSPNFIERDVLGFGLASLQVALRAGVPEHHHVIRATAHLAPECMLSSLCGIGKRLGLFQLGNPVQHCIQSGWSLSLPLLHRTNQASLMFDLFREQQSMVQSGCTLLRSLYSSTFVAFDRKSPRKDLPLEAAGLSDSKQTEVSNGEDLKSKKISWQRPFSTYFLFIVRSRNLCTNDPIRSTSSSNAKRYIAYEERFSFSGELFGHSR
jgi:hypothetical protein